MGAGFSAGRDPYERNNPVRPDVVADYSQKFLEKISHGTERDTRLQAFLHIIESTLSPAEKKLVVNATVPGTQQGAAYYLASQQQLFSQANLALLLKMGLDLQKTFSMKVHADLRTVTISGVNIFHCAAMYGREDLIAALPVSPVLQNARTSAGETPAIFGLKYAHDNTHAVRGLSALYEKGINLEARDANSRQLFHYALGYRQNQLLNLLTTYWKRENISPVGPEEVSSAMALAIVRAEERGFKSSRHRLTLLKAIEASPQPREVMVSGLHRSMMRLLEHDSPFAIRTIRKVLNHFHDKSDLLGYNLTSQLMNTPQAGSDNTFFSRLCTDIRKSNLVHSALRIGADPSQSFTHRDARTGKELKAPAIHHAAINLDIEVLQTLVEWRPSARHSLDEKGNTPLMAYLAANRDEDSPGISQDILYELRTKTTDLSLRNHENHTVHDLAIRTGDPGAVFTIMEGGEVPESEQGRKYESWTSPAPLTFYELACETSQMYNSMVHRVHPDIAVTIRAEAREILRHTLSVYQTYLYLVACCDVLEKDLNILSEPGGGNALQALSQSVVYRPPPSHLSALWGLIEYVSDTREDVRSMKFHQNEAEMMLLMNTPGQEVLRARELNPLTRALTSVTRFIDADMPKIGIEPVWNFARLGLYTHGFHQILRYEAQGDWEYSRRSGWQRTGPSLLESQLGFFPVDSKRNLAREFGPSLILVSGGESPIAPALLPGMNGVSQEYHYDGASVLVLSRGLVLISHPEWGDLVVRNSSRTFGRNLLRHPAFWRPPGGYGRTSIQDLLNLTREKIESGFANVLDPMLYRYAAENGYSPSASINSLLRQLDVFREHHRRGSFDTDPLTAFRLQDGKQILCETGGYRAAHFSATVEFLEKRFAGVKSELDHRGKATREVPDLIFGRPFFPAWSGFRFGHEGEAFSRLKITPDVLTSLRAYAENQFTSRTRNLAIQTGVHAFFQEAGFDHHAQLVMVSPR